MEAIFKADNVFPHVLILDPNLAKMNAYDLADSLLRRKERLALIFLSPFPEEDHFIDEVVTGQVQYVDAISVEDILVSSLQKALDWVSSDGATSYRMRFFAPGDVIIREGEKGDFAYLVKAGHLKAFRMDGTKEIPFGEIQPGEFVGEMAYINGEPRSANVMCTTACELIEMPIGHLDTVLFSKPAWPKALMKTLSKRLKKSNEEKE